MHAGADADLVELTGWVRDDLALLLQTGTVDLSTPVPHPQLPLAAVVASICDENGAPPRRRTAVVDLTSGDVAVLAIRADAAGPPRWSPDGDRLATLVTVDGRGAVWVLDSRGADPSAWRVEQRLEPEAGAVETVGWSPTGDRLAVIIAQPGAELSDVHGSGTVAAAAGREPWFPDVLPSSRSGRRITHVWDPATEAVTPMAAHLNTWEVAWSGPDRLLVLASDGAGEGAWYGASVVEIDTADQTSATRHLGRHQLAQPAANPTGSIWSVLSAPASDRGLLAGTLLVGDRSEVLRAVDTDGVDVTDHHWVDDDRVLFIGLRGLQTVAGLYSAATDATTVIMVSDRTNGVHQPELGGLTPSGELVVVLERHDEPPALHMIGTAGLDRVVASTVGRPAAGDSTRLGPTSTRSWSSTDGLRIDGLLTLPPGRGPFPLIVHIHGGPVAAWGDRWLGRDHYTRLLAARGYAVLRPNPRGSAGRGEAFIEAVIGDMGGRDGDDITTGVRALVDAGLADPARIGITGNSYGGYLAAWLPCVTDLFAAAVSRSPVTDWRSQHLTSNLAEFDLMFVGGNPFHPESHYATRSPLSRFGDITAPMLLTAGALDLATPASQARQMYAALSEAGVETQLVVYPQEGHGVRSPEALADQIARMVGWFDRHL